MEASVFYTHFSYYCVKEVTLVCFFKEKTGFSSQNNHLSLFSSTHAGVFCSWSVNFQVFVLNYSKVSFLLHVFLASWILCQRRNSRRYRKPFISSLWVPACLRPCNRPKNTPTASGTHSLSPSWVRRKSSSHDGYVDRKL